jgi:hypothetical protein
MVTPTPTPAFPELPKPLDDGCELEVAKGVAAELAVVDGIDVDGISVGIIEPWALTVLFVTLN